MATGLSIHLGVRSASGGCCPPETLTGPHLDAHTMAGIACLRGFDARIILEEDATGERVRGEIREAAARLRPGDIFLITFSGHGCRIPDESGDEGDYYDEVWCVGDGPLPDDLLREAWGDFDEGVRVVIVSDSCKSGSVHGFVGDGGAGESRRHPQPRRAPVPDGAPSEEGKAPPALPPELRHLRLPLRASRARIRANVLLLAASRENDDAGEENGQGVFTRELARVWADGTFTGSYAELMGELYRRLSARNPPQHPGHHLGSPRDLPLFLAPPFTI